MARVLLIALFPLAFAIPLLASALLSGDSALRALLSSAALSTVDHNRATFAIGIYLSLLAAAVLGHAIGHLIRLAVPLKGARVDLRQLSNRRFAQMHVVAALAAWCSMPATAAVLFVAAPLLRSFAEIIVFFIPVVGPTISTFIVISLFVARANQGKARPTEFAA